MQAVILAGGKGSRLGGDVPKPFVVINGKLLIRHVMDSLPDVIDEIIVVFPRWDSWTWVNYIKVDRWVTQPEPLGTGDALRWAYPYIRGDFLLLGADTIFQTEDIATVCTLTRPVVLAVTDNHQPGETALIRYGKSNTVKIAEKYNDNAVFKSLMLYKLPLDIFFYLPSLTLSPRGEYEIQDAINSVLGFCPYSLVQVSDYHHVTTGADVDRINRILSRAESAHLQR